MSIGHGEVWNNGMLEDYKITRLEDGRIGRWNFGVMEYAEVGKQRSETEFWSRGLKIWKLRS